MMIVKNMTPETFYAYGADLMKVNPAHFDDYPILARMARAGFVPGQSFDLNAAPGTVQEAFRQAAPAALARMEEKQLSPPASAGTRFTGVTGIQGPTRWRADGSSP